MVHWLRIIFGCAFLSLSLTITTIAQTDDLEELKRRVEELRSAGKLQDAVAPAERMTELTKERFGDNHPDHAKALLALARIYQSLSRFNEAEPLYKSSLATMEAQLGEDDRGTSEARNFLALFYRSRGRYVESEALLKRALTIYARSSAGDFRNHAFSLDILIGLYRLQSRYSEAEPLSKTALAMREKELGANHTETIYNRSKLAEIYRDLGRYSEAESQLKTALAAYDRAGVGDQFHVVETLEILTGLYRLQGRLDEAEPHLVRSLAIRERMRPNDPGTARSLSNLGLLYRDQRRFPEAEGNLVRAIEIREKQLGPDHLDLIESFEILAGLYRLWSRAAEAEPLLVRVAAIREKRLGPEHPEAAKSIANLSLVYFDLGRFEDAERLLRRALAIRESKLGGDHPATAETCDLLAGLYRSQARYVEAEPLLQRAIAIREKTLGSNHPATAESLHNLAELYYQLQDWPRAIKYYDMSNKVILSRRSLATVSTNAAVQRQTTTEVTRYADRFANYVRAAHRLAIKSPDQAQALRASAYEAAQWSLLTEAAGALAQMAARGAKGGNPDLAELVRRHQDLANEWRDQDEKLVASLSRPVALRVVADEQRIRARLDTIESLQRDIDKRLESEFPDYAALSRPEPLSLETVRSELRGDEALVLLLDTGKGSSLLAETFIWVVTRTGTQWARSDLGTVALTREVAALRCGLDHTTWFDDGAQRCADLLGIAVNKAPKDNDPLPFDHARAHKLYKALFGEVGDLIKGKHLLLVPSGPLTQLPFQVLVTRPSARSDHRSAAWFARQHPITVLPAVSSLKALRRVASPSLASKPMIGFGNPLLDGDQSHPVYGTYYRQQAALARAHTGCAATSPKRTASLRGLRRSPMPMPQQSAGVDIAQVRQQTPLPETADELCAVARNLKVDVGEIRLGARATERNIKALSDARTLAQYRIVHFATHGTLAGQLKGTNEPGLILTPPEAASAEDDGYLSASEIAALKLDAEWVILSACNTAAGAASAEALSGLARAFFYAQARALLVSHWEVNSEATVKLITTAVGALARNKRVGRAEALRRSMLALIDSGAPNEAHPAFWAPFIVVGEGASDRGGDANAGR
jgi:CHAT domain-containing protein/tetratricopeptide (TPR) repeat protein